MQWTEKYRPNSTKEFAGNPSAVEAMYKTHNKPLLLVGPPGSGKTTAALVLAEERDYELLEMNASDLRNKKNIDRIAGLASTAATFSGKKRLILFDEVDGMFRSDYGGSRSVLEIVKSSACPIILTANDEYSTKISSIKKYCEVIKFKKVHYATIAKLLHKICEEEGVHAEKETLIKLAKMQNGDMKSSINDLQALAMGKKEIKEEDLKIIGSRDRTESIFNAVRTILKTESFKEAMNSFDAVQEDADIFMKWVEENVPREYEDPEDLLLAMQRLSRADVYSARIMRRQAWSLFKFTLALSTAGVALAKKEPYHGFVAYQFPTFIRRLSASKAKRATRAAMAKKMAAQMHCSKKNIIDNLFFFQELVKEKPAEYTAQFGFDEKELAFLGVTPAKVKKALVEAEKLRKPL